ncbi:ECF transporter S component [Streptococcus ovuberis]|uniref:Riboflavin transporter n=1 Tax=Streptococcus ovuberis TaxID=1936207 RepID=A0A7X6S152_9STRE|nr:ECF transporter S component [Streptococcus ovuberis]NKZ19816.1 ECF transporter S component [Streptococcus ovuberis]
MTRTHKMAIVAILSALSFLLMFFQVPLIPAADFLQMDFSILPILVGLVVLDWKASLTILLLRSALKLILNSAGVTTYIGMPMNILALAVIVLSFAWIWKKNPSLKSYIIASVVATLAMTLAMLLANYVYAVPVYATFANFDIKAILGLSNYLFAMVVPFNLLQGVLTCLAFFGVYNLMGSLLKTYEK